MQTWSFLNSIHVLALKIRLRAKRLQREMAEVRPKVYKLFLFLFWLLCLLTWMHLSYCSFVALGVFLKDGLKVH